MNAEIPLLAPMWVNLRATDEQTRGKAYNVQRDNNPLAAS